MAMFIPELYPLSNSPFSPSDKIDLATPLKNIQDNLTEPLLNLQKKVNSYVRDEVEMRSIKILDIGYIASLYFIMGVAITALLDKLFGDWTLEKDSQKSTFRLGLELVGMSWLFGATTYLVRNIIELIPSPMSYIPLSNPQRKFEHRKVKELSSATVFTLILMGTSYHFKNKLEYFYKRITGKTQYGSL